MQSEGKTSRYAASLKNGTLKIGIPKNLSGLSSIWPNKEVLIVFPLTAKPSDKTPYWLPGAV
jgi:hypothetical protein